MSRIERGRRCRSPETDSGRPSVASASLAAAMAFASAPSQAQNILPTQGVVTSGAASIRQSGANLSVTQTSPRAIVNWGGFSIGQSNGVTFDQPSASSAILNRVTGSATLDDRRAAAGQRPGLSRQPERDRDHPDRHCSGRRRLRRLDARDRRQRLQQRQSPLHRQRRLGRRGQRRLDSGRSRRVRRPHRRNGLEFGRRLRPARKGRDGLGRASDAEPDRRQFSPGRRADEHEDGRRQGAGRRLRQGQRRGRIGAAQGGDGREGDPQRGQCAGRTLGRFGPRERRVDHPERRRRRRRLGDRTARRRRAATKGGAIAINGHNVALRRAKLAASSAKGRGGSVTVTGTNAVSLASTSVDASGATGGGAIRIGGDFHGASDLASAQTTTIELGLDAERERHRRRATAGRSPSGPTRRRVSPARSRRPAAPTAAMAATSKSPPIPPPTACSTSPAAPI